MADNFVTNPGVDGKTFGSDQIGGVDYPESKLGYGKKDSITLVSSADPFPVVLGLEAPKLSAGSVAAIAAGGTGDVDSAQIASGKTAKLVEFTVGGSVPLRGELKTVLNGVETSTGWVVFSKEGQTAAFRLPSKDFVTQAENAGAGLDGFRVTLTNLDNTEAADGYVAFFYDEV